jgi:hypothetical protein
MAWDKRPIGYGSAWVCDKYHIRRHREVLGKVAVGRESGACAAKLPVTMRGSEETIVFRRRLLCPKEQAVNRRTTSRLPACAGDSKRPKTGRGTGHFGASACPVASSVVLLRKAKVDEDLDSHSRDEMHALKVSLSAVTGASIVRRAVQGA